MSAARFACLPWYELAETRPAQDALWRVIARHLRRQGVADAPTHLMRGRPAPDMLTDPRLIFGQCCGYDLVYGFSDSVSLLATPQYDAAGCDGADYRSFILVRDDSPAADLGDLRGGTCVLNGFNSHSGTNALRALVAPLSRGGRFFGALKVSGAHMDSLAMLLSGEADVMAMDCVLHALLARHRPLALAKTRVICQSEPAPAPPFVTSLTTEATLGATLRAALVDAFCDADAAKPLATLLLRGIKFRPTADYARIVTFEAAALMQGYLELHATSPLLGTHLIKTAFREEIMPTGRIEKVNLGRTRLAVSKLCFGTSALGSMPGTYGYAVDTDQAKATLKAVFSSPVNFLDTARIYGHGRSEERVGAALKDSGGLPKGFVLSSKVDRDFETNLFDGGRVRRSLEESLKALGLDHIQLLHLHDPEYASNVKDVTKPGGALAELFKMKEERLVDAVGLAAGRVDLMMPLLKDWDFDAIITHNRFMLPNRHAEPMIDFCVDKGIAVLNAAPYAGGVLAKGANSYKKYAYQDASEAALSPIRRIEEICDRYHVPAGAAALQFSMRDPRVTSTIVGVSKPERIKPTIEWANWHIPEAAWEELLALPFATDDPEATRQYTSG